MELLEFENVTMDYGNGIRVISDLSFSVKTGEIFTLLGSSGCGKSTILRLIAGLETPLSGKIKIDGITVFDADTNLPAENRKIGFVFQDYALFPHLTVFENIVFGLYGKNKKEKKSRADELLKIVNLEGYEKRFPHELSGGQQQRVALARALAKEPALLLMDEPFSNLDTSLREKMRMDIYNIIKKTGTTALFVTHDQGEALSLSDKIAFLEKGKMTQVGNPHELYWKPVCKSTASFMGKANLIDTKFDENSKDSIFGFTFSEELCNASNGTLCIRPELVSVSENGKFEGVVDYFNFIGSHLEVNIEISSNTNEKHIVTAIAQPFVKLEKGSQVRFDIDSSGLIAWPNQ